MLVKRSNQKPLGDERYFAPINLKSSQYVSERSSEPVTNWRTISNCVSSKTWALSSWTSISSGHAQPKLKSPWKISQRIRRNRAWGKRCILRPWIPKQIFALAKLLQCIAAETHWQRASLPITEHENILTRKENKHLLQKVWKNQVKVVKAAWTTQ